jgi:NAD-dependent SIR2 family protein deacetylase
MQEQQNHCSDWYGFAKQGAGISVGAGIPDFRSHNGLYDIKLGKIKGKEMFDAALFRNESTTKLFYTFMTEMKMLVEKAQVTTSHKFLNHLKDKGKLLRVYTQNIDDLDARAGLSVGFEKHHNVVQLHGDIGTVKCTNCRFTSIFDADVQKRFKSFDISCPKCVVTEKERQEMGKRSRTLGCLRPNIVLYNEHHADGIFK